MATMDVVDHIFSRDKVIKNLPGDTAIGHVRYSTTGGTGKSNVQPLFYNLDFGGFAIAHNGDFTDSEYWRDKLIQGRCNISNNN